MTIRTFLLASLAALFAMSPPKVASAAVCDLTSDGASCGPGPFSSLSIFGELSPKPAVIGYLDPFLRLQDKGNGEGSTARAPTTFCCRTCQRRSKACSTGRSSSTSTSRRGRAIGARETTARPPGRSTASPAFTIWIVAATTGSNWITASITVAVPGTRSRTSRTSLFAGPSLQDVHAFSRFGDQPKHGSG